jgi:hypothetical protein
MRRVTWQKIVSNLVRWAGSASEILRSDFRRVKFRRPLSHRFEHVFQWRSFALNPAERIDTRNYKRAQIRADQSPLF